jgi:hypothetical protein
MKVEATMPDFEILPYKTINVFINQEYLTEVAKDILSKVKKLPKADQIAFSHFMRKHINVLGFRDSSRAPEPLQVNAIIKVFEEKDDVVPFLLSTWAKINKKLAKDVKAWLKAEGWENLETEREFVEGEGFIAEWPKKLTFDKLVKDYQKANPDSKINRDDLILMVLWVSGKLPPEQSDI